jgi:hypothetical protein
MTEQVAEGTGQRIDPTLSFEGVTPDVLRSASREDLVALVTTLATRLRSTEDLVGEVAVGRSAAMMQSSGPQPLDPQGYWATLGLDPKLAARLDDEQLDVVVKGAFRVMTRVVHSDRTDGDEWQRKLFEARDKLSDRDFRKDYGKPPAGRFL